MLRPFYCGTKYRQPATGCRSRPSAASRTVTATAQRSRSRPRARLAMQKCAPEAALKVRATRASILAWARRQESTQSSFAGQVDKSKNWERSRRTRNSSSRRDAVSLLEILERNPERRLAVAARTKQSIGRVGNNDDLRNLVAQRVSIFSYS